MKHLRLTTYILLIVGVLFLNIPFARAMENNVSIKSVNVVEKSGTITVDDISFSNNNVSSNITFNQLNDFVTLELEVENNTNNDYVLESIINNLNNEYLKVESTSKGITIGNHSTELVKVRIKYNNELINHSDIHLSNVSIGLGLRDLHHTFVNPITTENALIFIFAVALTVYFLLKKKKQQYAGIAAILLFLIPVIVFAKEDLIVNLSFSNLNIKARNIEYRVIIDDGNNNPQEITRTYGEEVGTLPEITPKDGYNSYGWVDQNNDKVTENTIVTDELIITPNYDPIKYTITYNIGEGTLEEENPTEYTIEDEFILNNPTVPGYTFAGWAEGSTLLLNTNVTIYKGTMGDKTFTAFYSANQDTVYTVIHRQMNMEGEYEETEREELHGATDTNVTPQPKDYPGFKIPVEQTQKIDGDGSTVFVYDYEREKYTFSITDRTNLENTSTPDGEYYFETDITLVAKPKAGYTFKWSDGDTNLERTFKLSGNTTLTPEYTARTDTPYTVIHKTMNLDGETYTTRDQDTFYGTTDTQVEVDTNVYEGFTAPQKETITITGDGEASVTYFYTRNKYTLTINDSDQVETTTPSGEYFYGTSITLKAKTKEGYHFVKWSNDNTNPEITFELKDNTTIEPIYAENNFVVTFNYNGGEGEETTRSITPGSPIGDLPEAERTNYYLDGWYTNLIGGEKITSSYIPTGDIELTAKWIKSVEAMIIEDTDISLDVEEEKNIVITNANEIDETYTFTSNDESIATVDSNGKITGVEIGETIITITGNVSHKTKTINVIVLSNQYVITFNGNGGAPESQFVSVRKGQSIAELPEVEYEKHFLDGWYTDITDGIKVEAGYTPTQNTTLYAKWKNAITFATITNTDIELDTGSEETIAITNANEIEENYTFESADEEIATVDENGTITGVGEGTTTITIRGTDSNQTVTINVTVTQAINQYTVHFDANGGTGQMTDQTIPMNVPTILNVNTFVRDNYTFNGWNTQADGEGESYANQQEVTNLTDGTEITLYAQWQMIPFPYVFRQDGACMFNGSSGNITGTECSRFTNAKYIDTGVQLYNAENHDKDYEIGFTIDEYNPDDNPTQATLMNTKREASGYPGVVYRKRDNTFELASRRTSSANSFIYPTLTTMIVRIYRINSEIYYSLDGGEKIKLNDLTEYNPVFDLNVWFGATPTDGTATTAQRFFKGTMSNLYIRLGTYTDDVYYRTTLDPNGGTVEPPYLETVSGQNIGTLPTPTKPLYNFLGWYTGITEGVRVLESYIPRNDSTIYARWQKKPVYQITVEENGGTTFEDYEIEQGTAIGSLPIIEKDGYNLEGWYLNADFTGRVNSAYVPTANTTIYAKWVPTAFPKVFEQTGECEFHGSSSNITGEECSDYTNGKYIDTGISLYSEENINKDYEIGFEIVSYTASSNAAMATFMNSKSEDGSTLPGVVFRRNESTDNIIINSRRTSSENASYTAAASTITKVRIYRISGKIYYSINGGEKVLLNSLSEFNPTFTQTVWFGAAPTDSTGSSAQRYLTGTLKNMYIKLGDYELNGKYKVSYNVNGGAELEQAYKHIPIGESIGELPTVSRTGYYFTGWYTSLDTTGQQVDANYTPTNSITLYAHWRKAVTSMNIENDQIVMRTVEDEDINISNASEIEEEWTYTSSNSEIATVDQNGKVTAVAPGETEITITGTTSNQTVQVYVNVYPEYTVTYDAQIGQYGNGENTNDILYGLASKNSRTENVAENGQRNNTYGNNWKESNIVGSSRGDTTKAHVVKFPDADKLHLDMYYGSASSSYDWVTVWNGNYPQYKASSNYSSGISGFTKLGGSSSSSQTINGNTVSNVYYKNTDITGNTLTFGYYVSYNTTSYANYKYGYYAVVKWLNTINGTYEEPTKDGAEFQGWYKDAECTAGQQFDLYKLTGDTTVYAKWGHTVTFNGNGGSTPSPSSREILYQNEIGTLPTSTRDGYYFTGWYTSVDDTGEKIETNYVPTSDITLYAHWKKSVASMTFESTTIRVDRTGEATINITNASEIEEEWTYTSANTSVATVDSTGKISGLVVGNTKITIRGNISNHTKTINVDVVPKYDVTYDANGGKYADDTTTKLVPYRLQSKYSYTSNLSSTGAKNSNYSTNSSNYAIRGTDRTTSSSSAHVITFPGAEKLYVDLYYGTYNSYYDRVSMISGNYPSYSISTGNSYNGLHGGYCSGTQQIINGNTVSNVCYYTTTLTGSSVTFSFYSDSLGSSSNYKYGYYAIVKGISNSIPVEEPTRDNMTFFGWYKDPECTDGQEFQNKDSNPDMTVYAKWGYRITYDANGGTAVSPSTKDFVLGDTIGTLPTTTKEGYYLDGWYTSLDISGEKVTSNYVPTGSVTLYAKWKKSVASITTDPASIITGVTLEEPINITNASEIEEEYTFESGNTSIATVDQTGTITGIAPGETTITIRGSSSNQTKTIPVKVSSAGIITYDANGGLYSDNSTVKRKLAVSNEIKYSHTENVDDTGKQLSNYSNNWSNSNIRGTGRTTASSEAHVITIPGASQLIVDVYHNGETCCDYLAIWKGSHPSYTYNTSDTTNKIASFYMNSFTNTYTVNGNTLTYMGYHQYTVPGDTVTFSFRSDGSSYGKGYGYYAIVSAEGASTSFEEPTKDNMVFYGWYKDPECSDGQEFEIGSNTTEDITVYAKWGYRVTYDVNGGSSITSNSKIIGENETIGELPATTKSGYYLDGWYTSLDATGEKVTSSYFPTSNITLYAKWKKSVASMSVSSTLSVDRTMEETISISNASSIEEEWTYTSSNTEVATVDENGKVTGVSAGTATITITGLSSGQTKTITVTVLNSNIVTYNANGGQFSDNTTINRISYKNETMHSRTSNISETGKKNSNYGNNWTNSYILGTGRTTSSSYAHVITIPGATSLSVTIYYNGQGTSYDWATVWSGSHSNYTASSNYSSGISGATKLGGSCSYTYVVNGNSLTNICKKTLTVSNSSVTFGFRSDSSGYGQGYGYYAIVTGISKTGTYKEPTNSTGSFLGWYKDQACTAGQEFNETNITQDYNVYAKWGYQVTYNVNGGNSLSPNTKKLNVNEAIGELPTPTRSGYYFDGWYTSTTTTGERITEDYVPTANVTIYAHWKKSVASINVTPTTIYLARTLESQINITNASSIEEEYTFESSDTSIATVDENGKVTGVSVGSTTIIIRGLVSNQTKSIPVNVLDTKIITYDANSGHFSNNETIYKGMAGSESVKYSHTENIDDTGKKLSNHGHNWGNANIRGTDRTTSSSDAHVVTIPGASQITVDIYYNGEPTTYDWSCVWEGSHPTYTAYSNYSSALSPQKIGGVQTGTYVVNGNTLTNVGHITYTINGDSATFSFRSDNIECGAGYGYYAIIRGNGYVAPPTPTKDNMSFAGWYTNPECTAGNEFNIENLENDITVYAKWGYQLTYDVNGGSSLTSNTKLLGVDEPIGALPTTTKSGYYLDGWYTSLNTSGEKVSEEYIPNSVMTIYAKWKKSVASMSLESSSLSIGKTFEKQINITNASSIEEEYTFSSSNSSIVTVDQNGIITGISPGTATITITGVKSGHTKTISVSVINRNVITYDANGGTFTNNRTINKAFQGNSLVKYSYTENLSTVGKRIGYYGTNWSNANIEGTDRGNSSQAHVITIPGASQLSVELYVGIPNSNDWVSVWEGSHPEYNAKNNYSSAISNYQKLSTYCTNSSTVNGYSLSYVCSRTFTVSGNSVTFGFNSGSTSTTDSSYNYGYYAIVKENNSSNNYEKPTNGNKELVGWYKDAACTAGQEFDENEANQDITVYAKWGYKVTYNVNGGVNLKTETKLVNENEAIGTLPTTTRANYYLAGWYTSTDSSGIMVHEDYVPTSNITLYAKWKYSVEGVTINNPTINLGVGLSDNIQISGSIEEDYSYTSSNTSIAKVDQNGKVTGVSPGTTTVTLRGLASNKTKQITVTVSPRNIITYDANGGTFTNNRTTIEAVQGSTVEKYSYTENINSVGYKKDMYGTGWTNANIRGTGRTSASSNAHVVTIPGASQITIDLYYGIYDSSSDWISIWKGSHPSYTATSNYSSAISGSQKIASYCSSSYSVNGITIRSVCKKTITVDGNTVTFGFTSNSTSTSSYNYGYYAVVKDANMQHTYEEPTKNNAGFLGWYKNPECTDGQEYDDSVTTGSMTVYAKWGHKVTYNVNGGDTFYPNNIRLDEGESLGELTTPKRSGYYFIGWYTSTDSSGIQVDENYVPTSNMTIYARWRKSVVSMNISPTTIYLGRTLTDQINITNASSIEEEWTYSSSNTSIATVDQTGKVTGISPGTATITIRGKSSNQTIAVTIVVVDRGIVTYNANGGKFSDNKTTNKAIQGDSIIKYSHTSNIDDKGNKFNDYGNNWTNANITGSDRGDTSKAHVITIPNASKLTVDVYYSIDSSGGDWLNVWAGNYPTYTAENNYNNSSSGSLSGSCNNTYTVNGITLTNVCHYVGTLNSGSATFGFKSNGGNVGTGYGYYAIVRDANIPHTYEEPTKDNAGFLGWYKNSSCTDGQEYDDTATTSDITVYAKWGYKVYYDVNGGDAVYPNEKYIKINDSIGTLPTTTRKGYYFDGWYTSLDSNGIKVNSNYTPTGNVTIYAKWKKSVTSMIVTPDDIAIDRGITEKITISNAEEIEENYTITSSNSSIAIVDQTGKVTGKAVGNTTIVIKGSKTNETITIPVTVFGNVLIAYDANGGIFSNNQTINYKSANNEENDSIMYSHTQNIDDTGKKNSNYSDNWGNSYIRGTGRTTSSSEAHVITITGAKNLAVDIYYSGESTNFDWVSVWEGSHPSYTAYSNYSSAITDAQKLGGPQSDVYTVNGNTLVNVGHKRLYISGDTVTFSYRSDTSNCGNGYGYYAIVKAASKPGTYEEPTRNNYKFLGWYKDAACTDGKEFNIETDTSTDITVYAKWEPNYVFDVNGGEALETNEKHIPQGQPIGELPTPTRGGYYFDGWYTSLDASGIKIEETTIPPSGMTLYAKWKKSVVSMIIDPIAIVIETGEEEQINITNAPDIEEGYTFVSNNESIATVDQDGKITGISDGETTITITGTNSNQTYQIPVHVADNYKITLDANGGQFADNKTTKVTSYNTDLGSLSSIVKYSHTSNIDDTGKQNGSYGNSWGNSSIRGTNRTTSSSEAHVITFQGAIKLIVDIYFNGESTSYDWVSVWEGSHPNYTASNNNASAIINAQKLGGAQTGTYEVNGNTLTNMGHISLLVNSNTVTFGFTSDGSYVGAGYGYYAMVRGIADIAGLYEEPTRENKVFVGWYKDQECSDGQEFNIEDSSSATTIYAAWANTVTFDTNGGSDLTKSSKIVQEERQIGTLPTDTTKEGYYLDGWYTSLDSSGVKVTEEYVPTSNETLYARWKKSVWNIVQSPPAITLVPGEEQTITVTNPEDIEEEYTYESGNTSIATVDNTGKVTAIATGSTIVNIRGAKSNQTKSISILVDPEYTVTYDASGGTFESGESTNQVSYGKNIIKYSHTSNIDDLGRKLSDYGNNWNNSNITGTDRGDTSQAHVITIPNAKTLSIDIYYNTQDNYYDWLSIWEGNHPDYTAANNYSTSYNNYRFGGTGYNTYTINGHQLKNIYKTTITIPGDTVTFGFKSDDSGIGGGYGYYAIVKGKQNVGRYEEPTKTDLNFYGWYTDAACTQSYSDGSTTGTRTVYAAYSYTITYDVNGGNALSTNTKQVKQESKIGSLSSPSKSGYYFDGWYTEKTDGEKITTDYIPTGNMTIYAHWKKSVAGMQIENTNIKLAVGQQVPIVITNLSEIEEEFTFNNYYSTYSSNYATVDENGIITGRKNGSSYVYILGKTSGQTYYINVTVQVMNYDVTLDSNGGDINYTLNYKSNESLATLPIPNKNHHTFMGWYTGINDGVLVDENYLPTSDVTLYARWSDEVNNTVSFNSNGGTHVDDIVVTEGQAIGTLPVPQKNQKRFTGWYTGLTDGILVDNTYQPTENITLYARWADASTYTITLDSNEGILDGTTIEVYEGTPIGELPTPTRENYYFDGWLDVSTNNYYYSTTIPTGNVTLVAQWNEQDYVARINSNYYSSISSAIESAEANDRIILLKDTTENITNDKNIIFDLNSKTLTGMITNSENSTLTIVNGNINNSDKIITNSGTIKFGCDDFAINDTVNITYAGVSSANMFVIDGGNIIVNKADINATALENSVGLIYGIRANEVTVNGGVITVNNNSTSSANIIGTLNSNAKITINDGILNASAKSYSSWGIYDTSENSSVVINGGTMNITATANNGVATGIQLRDSTKGIVVINGGIINCSAPNYRAFGIHSDEGTYYNIVMNGGHINTDATTSSSYGIVNNSGGSSIVINGGTIYSKNGGTSVVPAAVYNYNTSSSVYINGGNIISESVDKRNYAYGIYNYQSSQKLYFNGGTFKLKGIKTYMLNGYSTTNYVLPNGKQLSKTGDANGFTIYTLTNG